MLFHLQIQIDQDGGNHLTGHHTWFSCSHPRKTFCNVCREQLHGMAWHGLSCEGELGKDERVVLAK